MPTLIVLRHAEAGSPPGTPDTDRPLTPRGRRDASAAGAELRAGGHRPDRVICSPAVRARQTLSGLELAAPVAVEPQVYRSDEDDLLNLLREQEDVGVLLLIGHNPALHRLVLALADAWTPDRPPPALPPGAIAVVGFDGPWSRLTCGTGRLIAMWTP